MICWDMCIRLQVCLWFSMLVDCKCDSFAPSDNLNRIQIRVVLSMLGSSFMGRTSSEDAQIICVWRQRWLCGNHSRPWRARGDARSHFTIRPPIWIPWQLACTPSSWSSECANSQVREITTAGGRSFGGRCAENWHGLRRLLSARQQRGVWLWWRVLHCRVVIGYC